jgi:hypothetical protein
MANNRKIGVWQFMADDDPDVDAIYRLTNAAPVKFKNRKPLLLETGSYCPFNSQNTLYSKEFFPLLYLPAFVTFRFTDILRGIVAQPVLWANDHLLGFGPATVYQERNEHNLMKDFEQEIPMYLHMEHIVKMLDEIKFADDVSAMSGLIQIYQSLYEMDIVTDEELKLLSSWASDVQSLSG